MRLLFKCQMKLTLSSQAAVVGLCYKAKSWCTGTLSETITTHFNYLKARFIQQKFKSIYQMLRSLLQLQIKNTKQPFFYCNRRNEIMANSVPSGYRRLMERKSGHGSFEDLGKQQQPISPIVKQSESSYKCSCILQLIQSIIGCPLTFVAQTIRPLSVLLQAKSQWCGRVCR